MTPERFKECMAILHLSPFDLSQIIDRDRRRIRRWAAGAIAIPDDVAMWLDGWARYAAEHPPPLPDGREEEEPVQLFDLLASLWGKKAVDEYRYGHMVQSEP